MKYWVSSVTVAFVPAIVRVSSNNIYIYGWLTLGLFIAYVCAAIWSIVVSIIFLREQGPNNEARVMITRRHVSYICVNIFCQSYNMISKVTTNK